MKSAFQIIKDNKRFLNINAIERELGMGKTCLHQFFHNKKEQHYLEPLMKKFLKRFEVKEGFRCDLAGMCKEQCNACHQIEKESRER